MLWGLPPERSVRCGLGGGRPTPSTTYTASPPTSAAMSRAVSNRSVLPKSSNRRDAKVAYVLLDLGSKGGLASQQVDGVHTEPAQLRLDCGQQPILRGQQQRCAVLGRQRRAGERIRGEVGAGQHGGVRLQEGRAGDGDGGVDAAGPSRVDTAVTISRATFLQAHTAVLARADLSPDALAGAPLAAKHGAPLLLTAQDGLLPAVKAELRRLGVDTVYLLGSEAALASQVEQDVRDLGITTIRRLGKNGPVRHGPAHRRRGRWRGGVRGRGRGSSATETAANASFWWEAPQHQHRCGGAGQTPSRKRCRT